MSLLDVLFWSQAAFSVATLSSCERSWHQEILPVVWLILSKIHSLSQVFMRIWRTPTENNLASIFIAASLVQTQNTRYYLVKLWVGVWLYVVFRESVIHLFMWIHLMNSNGHTETWPPVKLLLLLSCTESWISPVIDGCMAPLLRTRCKMSNDVHVDVQHRSLKELHLMVLAAHTCRGSRLGAECYHIAWSTWSAITK